MDGCYEKLCIKEACLQVEIINFLNLLHSEWPKLFSFALQVHLAHAKSKISDQTAPMGRAGLSLCIKPLCLLNIGTPKNPLLFHLEQMEI